MGNASTTTIDFGTGSTAKNDVSVIISGQLYIGQDSQIGAWIRMQSTGTGVGFHSVDEARLENIIVSAGNIIPSTGFTIYASCTKGRASGKYLVDWAWS